ncbi:GH32 C-terminal domain-containing protein [Sunxiuqinia sp. A32]|uniref:GH32 C-terminal domain-containing protein n=1 Tax=Sunxiuqinia sp. A32 TaxID=3461496 RepID=UPI0040454AB1
MRSALAIIIVVFVFSCNTTTPRVGSGNTMSGLSDKINGKPVTVSYFNGSYHLYFSEDSISDDLIWGHYSSSDLLTCAEEQVAVLSDGMQTMISPCVVIDSANTSGFGAKVSPPMLCYYMNSLEGIENTIEIAYSIDEGNTWNLFGSILLTDSEPASFANPKVRWSKDFDAWIMTVSVGDAIRFYKSTDGIHWNYLSDFGEQLHFSGQFENPDFFPMKVVGTNDMKWVLWADMKKEDETVKTKRYFVGDFDGAKFLATQVKELLLDYGTDKLDGLFLNDENGDKIAFLWGRGFNTENEEECNQKLILARKLELTNENDDYFISSSLISEINSQKQLIEEIGRIELSNARTISDEYKIPEAPFILDLTFDNSRKHAIWNSRNYGVRFKTKSGGSLNIGYNSEEQYCYVDRSNLFENNQIENGYRSSGVAYSSDSPVNNLKIFFDGCSFQLFTCDNQIAMTSFCGNEENFQSFEIYTEAGDAILLKGALMGIQ